MNKKIKWAIPFAVLALTCGIAAGCDGCNKHEHSYTEWGYNETQHWKQCPEDDKIDESTKKDHNFVDGSCECGATQQTPPVTDFTVTNGTTDTNGTVTLSKTTAKKGDSVTVTVAPKEGYQLKSLTVNGANVFGAMTGNTYEFTVSENTTVIAVFEKIASSSVNAVITGKRYGVEGNALKAGDTATLSADGRDNIATEIKADGDNLVIKVDEIAGDNWSVKADGYVAATIIVPRDAAYTSAIALEYDLMENLSTSWGNYDAEDLSNQNDGKIAHSSGYYQWVSSKDSYESVAITAKVVKGGFRQGVFIRFKGDNYDGDGYVMLAKENQEKISVCGAGDGFKGTNLWKDNWDEYLKPLAKDEYDLTLVRDGANIYIFIDGEYKATRTLPEGYADEECYVGLFCTDATAMEGARTFAIQGASAFLEVSVTDETTDTNGTVTLSKTTAKLNEQVTVTLAPETGYKIKDLKIDGVSVLSQMSGNSYMFTALKDTTVVAEFEESKTVDSLELTVNAANGFTAEGAKITLEQLGAKWTGTVGANGKVTLGGSEKPVATGTHNVYADFGGYMIKLGTVSVEAPAEGTTATAEVTLGFTGSSDGKIEYAEAVSSANPATGELTYKLGKADHGAYNNKYDIVDVENGGYFATKIKFNDIGENKRSLSIILLVQKPDGTTKEIKYVIQNANRFFGEDGKFYMSLDDDSIGGGNGAFDKNNAVNIDKYGAALKGDGLWLVLGYNAETGGLVTYAGTELASVRPVKTWGTLPAGLKITDIGVGNWFGDSNQAYGGNNDTATVTFKYGATMEAIGMSLEEKVEVTASVNDEAMGTVALDSTDGKYFSGTQVNVTVTANAGYVLKSIKVGDGEAVTEGWTTDGNVYTYSFTVSASNTTVVATFEELQVWESATLTLNGVAENTEVKLYDGVDTITATAGANGVVTFTGEKQIGKKVYTVTVKNVVFNVDFTTESSIRKTIATVTADNFTAKDNYNDGAKVIDMGGAKNSTEYAVTFNLKTTSTAAGWQQRWSLLLINGDGNTTTGIGCIGKNDDQLLVWAAYGASPDDKNPTKYSEAKYLKFDELVHSANGVNIKVVRNGSKATMYFESEGEWIEMLSVTLGNGESNLKFACSYGVEWSVSNIEIEYISEFDYLVNASIEGDAHGYKVNVEQTANGATVTITTDNADNAWSYFPNAIKVNGTAIDFSKVEKVSLGANRCKYTYTLDITENTDIVVTVGKGTKVAYDASVNDGAMGDITCDMGDSKEYYWNDECTLTITPKEGYRFEKLVFGTGDAATEVSADDCKFADGKFTYVFTVTGDIKVVAHFAQIADVNVTVTVNAKDYDGTAVTLENGTHINFASTTSDNSYEYTVGSSDALEMQVGTYTVTCEGFFNTTATVGADGAVTVNLVKPIATSSSNEITVSEDKTIAIKGNGIQDRSGNRKINAEYQLFEEQKSSTGLTLTFTAKATMKSGRGGDDWAASRFGVQIGEGEIGFMVFPRYNNSATAADVAKLIPGTNLSLNPDTDEKSEQKWHGDDPDLAWLAAALYSDSGVQFRVRRANGVISIFAKNGEDWVALDTMGTKGETANANDIGKLTIGNTVKNEIKFLAGGDDWLFSNINVELPAASEKATLTASVNDTTMGTITTDIANYYKGDKAIITVTANQGYELEKLVIGETEITEGWTKEGLVYTYELTLTANTTVVANLKETPAPKVTPNITVSGAKYGSTETPVVAENTKVTLKNTEAGYEFEGTVGADGKIAFTEQIYATTYTVSATGYFDGTVTITEDTTTAIALKLYVETVDCEITVGETGENAKFVAEGATLTFKKDDVTKTVTVENGKVKLTDVSTGDWTTTASFGGYELHLGWTTVDTTGKTSITVDAGGIMWAKKEQEIAASNIADGTIEIKTNPAHHNKITLATSVDGGAMAFKFSLPADVKTKLATGDGKAAVTMPIGNGNGSLWVILFIEKSGENKTIQFAYYDKVSGGNWFDNDGAKRLDLSSYWDTLVVNDGLWIVANVNAKTAAISTYVGATLETAVNAKYDRTCTLAPLSFDKIEIGNGLGGTTENVCVTFKYGETLTALNVGKDVTLAKVNAEVTIGGTDNKYTAEGATLVFNHINGLYSVERKVTDNKVSLTDIPVGEYKVGAKVNGLIVDLGSITVADGDTNKTIALEAKPVFDPKKEQSYAGYDLAAGSFEIITNATYHNKIQFAQAGNGGVLALKFALPAGTDTSGNFKAVTSMPLNFADGSMWIVFRLEKNGDNKIAKFGFTSVDGGEYWGGDGDGYLDLSAQWDTIVSGGLWVVVDINAANGVIKTYTGASLNTVQDANFNRTCRSDNRIITALEIGNAIGNTDTNLCITLAYGETLDEVKALGGTDTPTPEPEPDPAPEA